MANLVYSNVHEPIEAAAAASAATTPRGGPHCAVLMGCFLLALAASNGCVPAGADPGPAELTWGRHGEQPGELSKPRAIAIDADDNLYIVDMTARIQVFDAQGKYLRGWRTPLQEQGRPTGLGIDREGRLIVADTHYFRVLFYTPAGKLIEPDTIGGTFGREPGQFGFVTDIAQDSKGNYYVAEYGDFDRIQKFTRQGKFVYQFGSHGSEPGQFVRPQSLAIDERDQLWVADACNHRLQVFDVAGESARHVAMWGAEGTESGQMRYPYGIVLAPENLVYVCEFGNHRIQKFTREGRSLGTRGGPGRLPGQFTQPWSLARDSRGRLHVLDSYNHRVQRLEF